MNKMIINHSILHILDFNSDICVFSQKELNLDSSSVKDFIEKAYEKWGIKIVAINLKHLISIEIRKVWYNEQIDLEKLLNSYGIINE